MPWLEDLKFPRGYQMGTHKIECRQVPSDKPVSYEKVRP